MLKYLCIIVVALSSGELFSRTHFKGETFEFGSPHNKTYFFSENKIKKTEENCKIIGDFFPDSKAIWKIGKNKQGACKCSNQPTGRLNSNCEESIYLLEKNITALRSGMPMPHPEETYKGCFLISDYRKFKLNQTAETSAKCTKKVPAICQSEITCGPDRDNKTILCAEVDGKCPSLKECMEDKTVSAKEGYLLTDEVQSNGESSDLLDQLALE